MTPVLYYLSSVALPANFSFNSGTETTYVKRTYGFVCAAMGLWSGLLIGYFTEYFTSNACKPVQKLA